MNEFAILKELEIKCIWVFTRFWMLCCCLCKCQTKTLRPLIEHENKTPDSGRAHSLFPVSVLAQSYRCVFKRLLHWCLKKAILCLLLLWIFTVYPPRRLMASVVHSFRVLQLKLFWLGQKGGISFCFFFFLEHSSLCLWFVAPYRPNKIVSLNYLLRNVIISSSLSNAFLFVFPLPPCLYLSSSLTLPSCCSPPVYTSLEWTECE